MKEHGLLPLISPNPLLPAERGMSGSKVSLQQPLSLRVHGRRSNLDAARKPATIDSKPLSKFGGGRVATTLEVLRHRFVRYNLSS